jgi:DNA adenine methylase
MSFFRYPGGKRKLLPFIINWYKEPGTYVEPFLGGGSVFCEVLKKFKPKELFINDLDVGIYSLWKSVFFHKEELFDLIDSFTPTVDLFYEYKKFLLTNPAASVEVGFKKLVVHQTSYSGLGVMAGGPLGGKLQLSKYKVGCRWNKNSIKRKIDAIRKYAESSNIILENLNFVDFLEKYYKENSSIYLDPPYYLKGSELYQHGFDTEMHSKLLETLKTKRNWLLSYDDCPEIRELYKCFCIDSVDVNYSINGSFKKPELLIKPN